MPPRAPLAPVLASLVILLAACAADPSPPPREPHAEPSAPVVVARPVSAGPSGGTSDGVTCEEARQNNVEELTLGGKGKGEKDLSAADLGAVLNKGTYLNECGVPGDAKVSVCVAVKNGTPLGVTVGMAPASAELESCVAKAVRALSFPAHPKMDIVKTQF